VFRDAAAGTPNSVVAGSGSLASGGWQPRATKVAPATHPQVRLGFAARVEVGQGPNGKLPPFLGYLREYSDPQNIFFTSSGYSAWHTSYETAF
jgi:hypothetical protein